MVSIHYDAPNAFGTMLRDKVVCDTVVYADADGSTKQTEMRYDGSTLKLRVRAAEALSGLQQTPSRQNSRQSRFLN